MTNTPTLRIGMIGHGFMGKTHTHAYRSLPYYYSQVPAKIELAGVATRTEESWKHAVSEWGYEFGTTDYRELCQRNDIDMINCCTPNNTHKDIFLEAVHHGKHVYMDKPLCCTLEEAKEIKAAAQAHQDCITQMTFQYRFIPAMLRAKQLIEAGALGRIFSARVAYLHAGYIDPDRPFSWRLDADQVGGGGALFDLGAHAVDLILHLLGPITSVFHQAETFIKERPLKDNPSIKKEVHVDDLSLLLFRLRDGGYGTLESSRVATGSQDEIRFEAHGDQGAIRFNLMQPNFLDYYDATDSGGEYGGNRGFKAIECVARYPKPASFPGPKNTIGWERFHLHSIYNFVNHVARKKPTQPDIYDGIKTQCVLNAALESSKTQSWIQVPTMEENPNEIS